MVGRPEGGAVPPACQSVQPHFYGLAGWLAREALYGAPLYLPDISPSKGEIGSFGAALPWQTYKSFACPPRLTPLN